MPFQHDLFDAVASAYSDSISLDNATLYERAAEAVGMTDADVEAAQTPVGDEQTARNLFHRRVRWIQQTLKHEGLLERVPGERGRWQLTGKGRRKLTQWADRRVSVVAFSTSLGVAILGDCRSAFAGLDEPITLCVTSPPYPLATPRAYGNPDLSEYIDFICGALEPVVEQLRPGGSVVLNVSNDIFEPGSPARSLYRERLLIALADRLGLAKMDEVIWHNPSKPPTPTQWASRTRQQLHSGYEACYWLTNDPGQCQADNRNVLEPHRRRQQQLIDAGGESRMAAYADGAHTVRPGSFGQPTAGRIPRNVLTIGTRCPGNDAVNAYCDDEALPRHGAMFPERLVSFFVEFLSRYDDLVVDPFAGACTVPAVAERLGRRWVATELVLEYLQAAGAARFSPSATWFNPNLWSQSTRSDERPTPRCPIAA